MSTKRRKRREWRGLPTRIRGIGDLITGADLIIILTFIALVALIFYLLVKAA